MRTGMLSPAPPLGRAAEETSPLLEKSVVLPRSLTVMGGHEPRVTVCSYIGKIHRC